MGAAIITPDGMVPNVPTAEGRALGREMARLCDVEAARTGRDGRCDTCAFRAGDHVANSSVVTLMTAIKCSAEREPFWCHEHDRPCAGWSMLRCERGNEVQMPWDHVATRNLRADDVICLPDLSARA